MHSIKFLPEQLPLLSVSFFNYHLQIGLVLPRSMLWHINHIHGCMSTVLQKKKKITKKNNVIFLKVVLVKPTT